MKKLSRKQRFNRWWKKNHHDSRAQKWLVKNAKRVAFAYSVPADQYEDMHYICKRFNSSEYKRLKQAEAWCLWRLCNPSVIERKEILIQTARYLDERSQELKSLKAQAKGLKHRDPPPMKINE